MRLRVWVEDLRSRVYFPGARPLHVKALLGRYRPPPAKAGSVTRHGRGLPSTQGGVYPQLIPRPQDPALHPKPLTLNCVQKLPKSQSSPSLPCTFLSLVFSVPPLSLSLCLLPLYPSTHPERDSSPIATSQLSQAPACLRAEGGREGGREGEKREKRERERATDRGRKGDTSVP